MMAENCCSLPSIREWKRWVDARRLGQIFYAECEYIHNIEHLMVDESAGDAFWRLRRPSFTYCCTHSHAHGDVTGRSTSRASTTRTTASR